MGKINIIFRILLIIGLFYSWLSTSFAYADPTLPELNQSTEVYRSYTFTPNETVTLNENMGTTSSGVFSVIGISQNENSILFNRFSGFVVSEIQTTLELTDLSLSGALSDVGAAIYNTALDSLIKIDNVTFSSNSVLSQTNAYGGAIYTLSDLTLKNTSFIGNYAQTQDDSSEANGGAIYSNASIEIIADSDNVVIVDNYIMDSNDVQENNAIYMANSDSTLKFTAQNEGTIYLYDNISGAVGYNINLTGDGTGTIGLFGEIQNANISISNVDISFSDNKITSHTLNNLTIGDNVKFIIDTDLANETADTISSSDGNGVVNISQINITSAPTNDTVKLQVLKDADNLTLNIDELSDTLYTTVGPTMYSTSLLADSISLGTTDTTDDSIVINGWKDVLYEMVHDTLPTHMIKNFIINSENEYLLTKDLGEIPQEIMLTITNASGKEYGVINANNHFMFEIKNPITSIEINNTLIKNAKATNDGSVVYLDNAASDFTANNSVITSNSSDRNGGAIYIKNGTLTIQNSTLSNNTAGVNGGAIYATEDAQVEFINTDFKNNTAGEKGGAIYTDANIKISADNGSSTFEGNSANGENNAIYAGENANITLNATNNGNVNLKDKISGSNNRYRLNVSGDETGNINIENSIENANITLNSSNLNLKKDDLLKGNNFNAKGGNLNLVNNEIGNTDFNTFSSSGKTNIAVDVDLENKSMDRITANNYSNVSGKINVKKMNLLSDATTKTTKILFADSPLKNHVTNSVKTTAYSRVYKYMVSYSPSNGYFTFTRGNGGYEDFNPAVLSSGIAQQVAYLNQLNNYQMAMYHSYTYMTLPKLERNDKYRNAYSQNSYDDQFNPTYMSIPEEHKSIWVSPYSTFESIPLKRGPKITSINYGTLFGGDSDYIDIGRGFGLVYGGYVGYNGNNYHFKGIDSNQQGAVVGLTANIYKNNFYNTITANVGWQINNTDTPYGSDTMNIIMTGFADKIGYNFELIGGKLIIQPSVMMGYTFVSNTDYTSSGGVRIESDPLHVMHFIPGIRVIGNLANGWQPYALVNVVCNFFDKTNVTANNIVLPRMSIDPYVEYGLGIQKRWADKYSGYAQATVRSGGRRGASLLFGFRCMLGKLVEKTSNIVHKDPEKKNAVFKKKKEPKIDIAANRPAKQPKVKKQKQEKIARRPSFNVINMLKEVKRTIFYRYNTDVSAKVVTDVHPDGVIISNLDGEKSDNKNKNSDIVDYKDQDRIENVDNIKPEKKTVKEVIKTTKITPKKVDTPIKNNVNSPSVQKIENNSSLTKQKSTEKPVLKQSTEQKSEKQNISKSNTSSNTLEKQNKKIDSILKKAGVTPEQKPAEKPIEKHKVKSQTIIQQPNKNIILKDIKAQKRTVDSIQKEINSHAGKDKLIIVKPVPVKPAWVKPEVKDSIINDKNTEKDSINIKEQSIVNDKVEQKENIINKDIKSEQKLEKVQNNNSSVQEKTIPQKTDYIKRLPQYSNKAMNLEQSNHNIQILPKKYNDYTLDVVDFKF